MDFKTDDLQAMLNVLDMSGELEDWHKDVDCPDDVWLTPPPIIKLW